MAWREGGVDGVGETRKREDRGRAEEVSGKMSIQRYMKMLQWNPVFCVLTISI